MSNIFEEQRPTPGLKDIWRGKIASSPPDFTTKVYVTIPDLDPNLKIGPARWQTRDPVGLPVKGDDCLVILDNDNEPWVVMWWPFA